MKAIRTIILFMCITGICQAQYSYEYQQVIVQTPTGVPVDALQFKYWVYDDFDPSEQAAQNYNWTNGYNCTVITSSTKYYNCHGYAWHNVEGNMGQSNLRWINNVDGNGNPTYNVHRYYNNNNSNGSPSYVEVGTNSEAGLKVSYFPRDHSAVTTSNPQKLISKWAWGPLVEHAPAQCPFYQNAQIKYYKRIIEYSLSGPTSICSQSTFTLSNVPSGATIVWSCSNNIQLLSGQGTGSAVFKKVSNGEGMIYASVNGAVISQYVFVGTVPPGMIDAACSYITAGGYYQAVAASEVSNKFEWGTVDAGWTVQPIHTGGMQARVKPASSSAPTTTLRVRAQNDCGWGDWKDVAVISYGNASYLLSTYPNPATDVLKLSIRTTDEARRQQLEALATGKSKAVKERTYTVQLFGTMGNLVQQKKAAGDDIDLSFDVSGLPGGTYFVVVKLEGSDEEPQRATVIVRK